MIFIPNIITRSFILIVNFAVVTGCSINTHRFELPVEMKSNFSQSGLNPVPDQWWLCFDDPELNRIIGLALQNNFDINAAFARLEQARAVAVKAGSELIPAVNGSSGINRSINDPALSSRNSIDTFAMGLSASYELDLWGRIRAGTLAAELDVEASELDIQTAGIALSAEITRTWFQLIEQKKQLQILNQQIETNRQNVNLITVRFQGGQATVADLFQQTQILEAAISDRYTVLANLEVLKNQIAILTGQAPRVPSYEIPDQFPVMPELPQTGLTFDLINRRPDIASAYRRLQAADVRIAAAVADRLPKISISAGIDTTAPDLHDFFNNWMATLAANLLIPIIDGGRRIAEVDRNEALKAEAFNGYGQQVLESLAEVENALVQETRQQQRLESLKKQLRLLNQANNQIRLRYIYGAMDFLRVLSSQISLQSMQRTVIRAELELLEFRISLYRSLSGGWTMTGKNSNGVQNNG